MACERYDSCETVMGKKGLTGLSHGVLNSLIPDLRDDQPEYVVLFGKDFFRAKRSFLHQYAHVVGRMKKVCINFVLV
jgi:hypothetical protein